MEKKQKIKRDVGKIVIKIVAAVLALLMVLTHFFTQLKYKNSTKKQLPE